MKIKYLRPALLLLGILLTVFFVIFSRNFLEQTAIVVRHLPREWWPYILVAILIQLCGHWLRMLRTKTIIDQVKIGKESEQFGALGVGYLFNTLLPLRLGELLRAGIIATRLRISFVYTFAVIVLERAIDLLLIGCVVILVSSAVSGRAATTLLVAAIGAIMLAGSIIVFLVLLVRENKRLLSLVWKVSSWLNVQLSNSLRFKIWSLIFGLQQFIRRKRALRRYALLAIGSWICYVLSMYILAAPILHHTRAINTFTAATSPYVAVSAPSGPAYIGNYEKVMRPVLTPSTDQGAGINTYIALSWLVLSLPMFIVGLSALFWLKLNPVRRTKPLGDEESFANKLLRRHDLSQEFPAFLDTYFLGHNLSRVLHKIEVAGELSLVKFFKGGSNAITMLALQGDRLFVKKIVPPEYRDRLRNQYLWLKKHGNLSKIVKVEDEQTTDSYYAIDLEYRPKNIPFFEYLHDRPLKASAKILDEMWAYLFKNVYKLGPLEQHTKERDEYIKDRLENKLKQAAEASADLTAAMQPEKIIVNGEMYDNLLVVLKRIKKHKQAWQDLATYRASTAVHGDVTIDNILVDMQNEQPLLIDPSDDNQIRGPVLDFGRHIQSLAMGYEFLCFDDEPVELIPGDIPAIHFHDLRSARYMHLYNHVIKEIVPKYLSEAEQRAIMFHVGLFYGRVLAHRVVINPENVLKFYGVSVKALNEFIAQYDKTGSSI